MFSEASHGWPLDAALRPRQVEADECVCREKPRWGRRTVIVGPMRLRSLFAVMPCRTSGRRCTCHCNSRVPVASAPGTLHMFADRNPVPHRTTSSSVTASCAVKVHFQTGAVARRGVGAGALVERGTPSGWKCALQRSPQALSPVARSQAVLSAVHYTPRHRRTWKRTGVALVCAGASSLR